jgi:CBS domain-containing protein
MSERQRLGAVTPSILLCVSPSSLLDATRSAMAEHAVDVVAVVGAEGEFVGAVGSAEAGAGDLRATVASRVDARVPVLSESERLTAAVLELARGRARFVAVGRGDGTIVGLLSDLELLRWFVRQRDESLPPVVASLP